MGSKFSRIKGKTKTACSDTNEGSIMMQTINYKGQEAGSSLNDDIDRLTEEFEVEKICRSDEDPESDLHRRRFKCKKKRGHVNFIPEPKFTIEHLPVEWRDPLVYKAIRATARRVVQLSVFYTSPDRPDDYLDSKVRGQKCWRIGTGYAEFPSDYQNKQPQECPFKDCTEMSHPHNVTPEFYVNTASHVVFDSSEAEETLIRFFFDSEDETKGKAEIKAQGIRCVESDGTFGELCRFTCVSHNLNLQNLFSSDTEEGEFEPTPSAFGTEEEKPKPPVRPTGTKEKKSEQPLSSKKEAKPEPPLRDRNSKKRKPLVVIVSHPHGCSKHVSTGYCTGVKPMLSDFFKSFGNKITLRDLGESSGIFEMLLNNTDLSLDTTVRQCLEQNLSTRPGFFEDLIRFSTSPLTVNVTLNEILHKILLAMWDKTVSRSKYGKQVFEEELEEVALSVLEDIVAIKSPEMMQYISVWSLELWEALIFDQEFNIQLSREEFSEMVTSELASISSGVLQNITDNIPLLYSTMSDKLSKCVPGFKVDQEAITKIIIENLHRPSTTITDDQLKEISNFENYISHITYSTKTCPGSSGAPVILFFDNDGEVGAKISLHFGTREGVNGSGSIPFVGRIFEKLKQNTNKPQKKASQNDIPLD